MVINSGNNIAPNFGAELFWDIDPSELDWHEHRFYVIERVLERGNVAQFLELIRVYGREEIAEVVSKSRQLNPRMRNFCALYFELPLNDLCTKQPSYPEHWHY